MSQSKFSPRLLAALDRKVIVDMRLLRLQQGMRNGKQPFSASAILSALEDCDETMEVIWQELGHTVCERVVIEAQENSAPLPSLLPIELPSPARTYTPIAAAQLRVRQFFTKTPNASAQLHAGGTQKQKVA